MTYIITTKNITKGEPTEVFSDNFKAVLDMFISQNGRYNEDFHDTYSKIARVPNNVTGLIENKLSKEELGRFASKQPIDEKYKAYSDEYKESRKMLKKAFELLDRNAEEVVYHRICPITQKDFCILTGKDIKNVINSFTTSTWHDDKLRDYNGFFYFIEDKSSSNDELKIKERFHPDVVDKIVNEWNFKSDIEVTTKVEDGTAIELFIEDGSVSVVYNPHNTINYLSIQNIKIYSNTKGLHYRVRGRKRVYLDLPEVKVENN